MPYTLSEDSCAGPFGNSIELQGQFFVEETIDTRSVGTKEKGTPRSAIPVISIGSLIDTEDRFLEDINFSVTRVSSPVASGSSCFPTNKTEAPFVEECEHSNLEEVYATVTKQMGCEPLHTSCKQWDNAASEATTCKKHCSLENPNSHSKVTYRVSSDSLKAHKGRGKPKRKAYDWDNLRKEVLCNGGFKQRGHSAMDTVDWEAIRHANLLEIADAIRERGCNNKLAAWIKEF
uniref:Uncharacterized protein n=1 Tax=Arundo donax TaxID=35708 RepID=A0A0A9C1R6_ARUDO